MAPRIFETATRLSKTFVRPCIKDHNSALLRHSLILRLRVSQTWTLGQIVHWLSEQYLLAVVVVLVGFMAQALASQ